MSKSKIFAVALVSLLFTSLSEAGFFSSLFRGESGYVKPDPAANARQRTQIQSDRRSPQQKIQICINETRSLSDPGITRSPFSGALQGSDQIKNLNRCTKQIGLNSQEQQQAVAQYQAGSRRRTASAPRTSDRGGRSNASSSSSSSSGIAR